jgi:hypothetical protein
VHKVQSLIDLYSCARSTGLNGSQNSRDNTRVKYCFENENLVRNKLEFLERRVYCNNSNIREPTRNKTKVEGRYRLCISGGKVISHRADREPKPTAPYAASITLDAFIRSPNRIELRGCQYNINQYMQLAKVVRAYP